MAFPFKSILDMTLNKITNLGTPTADTDAATKKYVDDELANYQTAATSGTADPTGGSSGDIYLQYE